MPSGCRHQNHSLARPVPHEDLVDEGKCIAYRKRLTFSVEHPSISRVDRHARTDGCLGKIDRGDIAPLEVGKGHRQLGFEFDDELTKRCFGCICSPRAADKDDA